MRNNVIQLNADQIDALRIKTAKWAYATRRIPDDIEDFRIKRRVRPKAGDLVLAKVKRIGQHKRIELVNGRRARLFIGDKIVVAYGNRYAPDQFEAIVPEDLKPCQLVAAGGIAGQMIYKHGAMKPPTAIKPLGVLVHENGKVVNLLDYAVAPRHQTKPLPPVIAVVGGSMNAGKTTTAASLIRGLVNAGFSVSAGKVTGTGSGCDPWHLLDAGARLVMDFLDTGHPSTYLLSPGRIEGVFTTLLSHLNQDGTDYIIIEVADGLYQSETQKLIGSDAFCNTVKGVLYAAADALGAVHGVEMMQQWGVPVFGVSGVITRSPLSVREILDAVDVPVLGRKVLSDPVIKDHVATWLLHQPAVSRARSNF